MKYVPLMNLTLKSPEISPLKCMELLLVTVEAFYSPTTKLILHNKSYMTFKVISGTQRQRYLNT